MQPTNDAQSVDLGAVLLPPKIDAQFFKQAGDVATSIGSLLSGPKPEVRLEFSLVYVGEQFSTQELYQAIVEAVAGLQIPGVEYGPKIYREGGFFSAFRTYLQIRREFSEFLVCGSPVGTSYFVTVRKIDRYPHAKWFHYLIAVGFLGFVTSTFLVLRGFTEGLVYTLVAFALIWSVLRYASQSVTSVLGRHLPDVPVVGALYLKWFRPETFYRQDLHSAFLCLVEHAIRQVVDGLEAKNPLRPDARWHDRPIHKDFQKNG